MDSLSLIQNIEKNNVQNPRIGEVLLEAGKFMDSSMKLLEPALLNSLRNAPDELDSLCRHILSTGGKRIRPALCLLAFHASGGKEPVPLNVAVSCELLHNATLLHDDVIDEGDLRRGNDTARKIYGNAVSILGGDLLLVRALKIISKEAPFLMEEYLKTLESLVAGEIVQLNLRGSIDTSIEEYFKIIEGKTASLFKWAAWSGSAMATENFELRKKLACFGWNIGIAFQIMDDILDFNMETNLLSKNLFSDIKEGKITLPVILSRDLNTEMPKALGMLVNDENKSAATHHITQIITECGALKESEKQAQKYTDKAVKSLENTFGLDKSIKKTMVELAKSLVGRKQ